MLPAFLRFDLRSHSDTFFANARSRRFAGFRIFWQELPPSHSIDSLLGTRSAIIVAKRAARGSQRVQIKRQYRHALIELQQEHPTLFALPYWVVFLVQNSPTNFADLKKELLTALQVLRSK